MKIGKFASENHLSIDAIRHYMELGLILPEKKGGQYEFDEGCQKDLEDILTLKELGFTLNEIKSISLFKRLGKLTPYQEDAYYKEFFQNKYFSVSRQIEELKGTQSRLEEKLKELSLNPCPHAFKIGVDIGTLGLFQCLKCHSPLMLGDAHVSHNQIMEGKLECSCGEEYRIRDGILVVGSPQENKGDTFDEDYLGEYIHVTHPQYLHNVYRGMEWAKKRFDFEGLSGKTLLELGTGMGFLLRQVYGSLPDNAVYLAIDHEILRHQFLKKMLERSGCRKKIIFICADFLELPIKDKSIDMVIDYTGTSNYSFDHEAFLLEKIDHYVKEEAFLLGMYILFKNFRSDSYIDKKYRSHFMLNSVQAQIKKLGYGLLEDGASEIIEEGGIYESYFKKGEKVYSYAFYGKRGRDSK